MKAPFIIYADFEALVKKIHRCKRPEGLNVTYIEETDQHEACGFSNIVVRSDGQTSEQVVSRGENAVGKFLSVIVKEETKIREILSSPHPIVMSEEDWQSHKIATDCHICDESLFKDSFLDSLPVWNSTTDCYCGQSHKRCYYEAQKKMDFIRLRSLKEVKDKINQWIAKTQDECLFCAEPLLRRNFRLCKGPLSHNRQVPRSRAQCMPS